MLDTCYDGVLIHKDKEYLKYCLKEIGKIVSKYKLKLNNKTSINHIKNGLDFLGFRFYIINNKVVLRLRNTTKKNFKRKIKKYYLLYSKKKVTKKEYNMFLSSYLGHLKIGNCFYLVKNNKK